MPTPPLTPDQRLLLVRVGDSWLSMEHMRNQHEDNIRRAVESGVPFSEIGLRVGTSGRAVAYLAARRGWYRPGDRRG